MSDTRETGAIARGLGKWGIAGVPHKGWTCTDIKELEGDDRQTCEMCETMQIRFVHVMEHPGYGTLECGCICAGNMEGSVRIAKDRERVFKNSQRRRAAFPRAKGWRTSMKGNRWITHHGYRVTIIGAPGSYRFVAVPPGARPVQSRLYPTIEAAQIAGYDYVARNLTGVGMKV